MSARAFTPAMASAVSRSVLLGMVPVFTAAPPTAGLPSISATFWPRSAAVSAAATPPGPAPITIMSNCFAVGIAKTPGLFHRSRRRSHLGRVRLWSTRRQLRPELLPLSALFRWKFGEFLRIAYRRKVTDGLKTVGEE